MLRAMLKTLRAVYLLTASVTLSTLVTLTDASHFRGGIISWRPLEQPNGNLTTNFLPKIEISVRVAWRRTAGGHFCTEEDISSQNLLSGEGSLSCSCNGLNFPLMYYCTDFSETEDWSTGVNSGQYQPASAVFDVWLSGCCWIYLRNGGSGWDLGTSVNLTIRSDTGLINSSPTTSTTPIIRFQRGCNNTVKIPVSDPDGDYVRCFWATRRCGGICGGIPGAVLDENTCELNWNLDDSSSLGLYGVSIEIADFASPTSTNPLSYIPLQFLIDVISSTQSCFSKPVFIPPTRLPGSCVGIPPNTTYHEPVIARSGSPQLSITEIDTVTPAGVEKSYISPYSDGLSTDYYLNVTWTPETVGFEEILCFTARDSAGSDSTQSCFTLVTGTPPPLILNSSLQPPNKEVVLPSDLTVKLRFDQVIVRPDGPSMISLVADTGVIVYQLDSGDLAKVNFIGDRELEFIIPGQFLEERVTYRIHMDSGIARSTTFCGVESPKIVDDFWTFTVRDITPPVLLFNPILSRTNENVTISWTINEEGNTTCTLSSPTETDVDSCDGSWTGTLLSQGYHTLYISATDTSGNTGPSQQVSWFVDKTPPDVNIYVQPGNVIKGTSAEFSFRCTDYRDSCQFTCGYSSVDQEPNMGPCSSPFLASRLLNDIQYWFSIVAVDSVGNEANEVSVTWFVDTEPPTVSNITTAVIACNTSFDPNVTGIPSVLDNQDIAPTLTYVDLPLSDCSFNRVWTATDAAGNLATSSQRLLIENELFPQVNLPPFVVIPCSDDFEQDIASANSNNGNPVSHPCGRPVKVTYTDDVGSILCGAEFTRFWTIEDDCGNSVGSQQRIRVLEVQYPESPANGQVNLRLEASLSWPSYPGATYHRIFVWKYESIRPSEPVLETYGRTYTPSVPYPPNTRMLWQVEYVLEGSGRNRRQAEVTFVPSPIWGFVTMGFPDLTVTGITLPEYAFSGQSIEVSWEVQNIGHVGLSPIEWIDGISFSLFPDSSENLQLLTSEEIRKFVDPADGYVFTASWTLPEDLIGTFYVFVETDLYNRVDDLDRSNNIRRADGTIEIRLTPPPDLQVTSVVVPSSTFSGLNVDIRWSVHNLGLGITQESEWSDRIFFSEDGVLDRQDQPLLTVHHDGLLSPETGYSEFNSVQIPDRIFGEFYFIVATDVRNEIYEHASENNNELNSSRISVILSPPADLEVIYFNVQPNPAISGDSVVISWEVRNGGSGLPDSRYWYDRVQLGSGGISDQTVSLLSVSDELSPSQSYQKTSTFTLKDSLSSGTYQIYVATDSYNNVFEFDKEENNQLTIDFEIVQKLPDLIVSRADVFLNSNKTTGELFLTLNWTVTNVGPGKTLSGSITDSVSLISCMGACADRYLGHRIFYDVLPSQGNYSVTNEIFLLPNDVSGKTQVRITTDASSRHLESTSDSNTITIDFEVPCLSPSLVIDNLQTWTSSKTPVLAYTVGEEIAVTWRVTNEGNATLKRNEATVVLSLFQTSFPVNTRTLSRATYNGYLSPLESFIQNITVRLPSDMTGNTTLHITHEYDKPVCGDIKGVIYGPIDVQPPPTPRLKVSNVHWITQVSPSESITIRWTVENIGNTMTAETRWSDEVFISSSHENVPTENTKLGLYFYNSVMTSGQHYNSSKTLLIPQNRGGTVYVGVSNTFELIPGQTNPRGQSAETSSDVLHLPEPILPDLYVSSFSQVPFNVSIGSRLTVYFNVKNNGSVTTASSWTDHVHLVQQHSRIKLGQFTHKGLLDFQEEYNSAVSFQAPINFIGRAFIEVNVDATSQVKDSTRENNVNIIAEVELYEGPLGDLIASIEKSEIQLGSGAPFFFEYNTTNRGVGLIAGMWNDAIYLSQDAYIDPFDVRLGSNANSGPYYPGETFQKSVELFLPFDLPNSVFYLIIVVDSRSEIYEDDENNNIVGKSIVVRAGISTDLSVLSVASPSTASYGNNFLVSWSVENIGLEIANGYKCDTVYLSTDREWNVKDSEIGHTCSHFSLNSNSETPTNTGNYFTDLPLPLVTAGEQYTVVRTRSNIRDPYLQNNIGIDDTPVLVSFPELKLGEPVISQIELHGRLAFKIPSVPADETLILEISSPSEFDVNNVFLKYKEVATANNFDVVSRELLSANQTAAISPTRAGDYFALIQNNGALGSSHSEIPSVVYISAKIAQFEILSVQPTKAAPLGNVTVTVHGTVFPEMISAKLRSHSGLEIPSSQYFRFSSQELYITFDISSTDIGTWFDLILNEEAEFSKALQIVTGAKGMITASVNNPVRLRPFEVGQVGLDVKNEGNIDTLVPLLMFTISEPGEARLIAGGEASDWAGTHVFFPTPSRGPAGIFSPGSSQRFTFEVRSSEPTAVVEMSVSIVPENPNTLNLFTDSKDVFKPYLYGAERWDRVWEAFLDVTGPSHETFTQHTSNVLNHLSILESRPRLVGEVLRHQINLVDGFGYHTSPVIEFIDFETPPSDRGVLSLRYAREMDLRLSFRTVKGVFGRGWTSFWWNIKVISANDTHIILEQDNSFFDFLKNEEDGSFENVRGIITANDTELIYYDAFSVYERLIVFDSVTFALKYVTATDDLSKLTFETNDNNLPILITSSTGSSLSITYTLSGLVEEVDLFDRLGRVYQTARYTYDKSGTYLMSAENNGKITSYTYASDGALASITDYMEVQQQFHYNVMGILEEVTLTDSSGEVITSSGITDHRDGRVTVLDYPSGLSSTFTYTLSGEIGSSQTAGYPTYKFHQNTADRLVKMFWGDHVTSKYLYDPTKKAYYIYNGNNDMREVSTDSSGQLKYFIDANNNKYEYNYDEESRVRTLIYPDGRFESRKYDEKSFVTEQISRKGTKSSFAVNEDGLIIERHNEGDDHYYFMYNERGLVTEATNNVGTIKITYTSGGEPRTVEYPDGKTLIYDYDDKGRRIGLRDGSSYHVTYEYDIRDRVVNVMEGDDKKNVVHIIYDKNSRISKKIFPNGCESVHRYRMGSSEIAEIINSCNDSIISSFEYKYNYRGLCNRINSTFGNWKITYDGNEQVVAWNDPQGNNFNVGYDNAGNRRFLDMNGDVTSYTINELNQYLQVGSMQINYDDNGNVIATESTTHSTSYEFNVNNQLITSQVDGNECIYHYNAMGTLHEKICSGHKTVYYMDFFGDFGADVVIETTKDEEIKYFHSSGIGLIGRQINGNSSFYQFDGTGSVVGVVDENGYPFEWLAYDPFGNIVMQSGPSDSLFQFSGQFGVLNMRETGFYLMRTRLYNSQLGRFMSPDSFGYSGSPSNMYVYARNNPIKYADPLGTFPIAVLYAGKAVVSGFVSLGAYYAVQKLTGDKVTTGGLVGSFVGGAATGLAGAFFPSAGFWGKVGIGAVGGIISDVTKQVIDPGDFNGYDTVENALVNGALSGILPGPDYGAVFSGTFKKFAAKTVGDLVSGLRSGIYGKAISEIVDLQVLVNGFLGWIRSFDPNDILGPTGFGDARFVTADSMLNYRIRFENDANASAPAQLVTITTSLDNNVDIATFQLGEFGFGNFTNKDASRSPFLQKTIEFIDGRSYVVRVTAGLDVVNRRVTWEVQTLDPETGRPPTDPGVGFLPPNPENGTDGEGFVTYSVKPQRGVKTYDVIEAEARIIFDKNDPIDTEPTFNTIDRDAPFTRNVTFIDDVLSSGILAVSVRSRDEGAGVKAINIFSNNGGEYNLLASSLAADEVIILDIPMGVLYNLLILPEDNVGNRGSLQTDGVPLEVFFPEVEVSCKEVNNCSGAGNCTNTNLCQCEEGRYGVDCSQEIPPKEPPVIAASPAHGEEDDSVPFPLSIQLVNPSPNDTVEIRLINVLEFFTLNIGTEDGYDLLVSISESRDLVLQPLPDLSGEFVIPVEATVTDNEGNEGYRRISVPVAITAVADEPTLSVKESCFDFNGGWNSTFILVFNVTSGDVDFSEMVSVDVSDFWNPSVSFAFFPNVTMDTTQVFVNMTLLETDIFNSSVEVTIRATSIELSNGDEISTTSVFAFPMCESNGTTPMEPPVIEVSPMFGIEDMPLPFSITVKLVNPSPNDKVELRLINILDIFTQTIGVEDGKDLVISISKSRDLVLQPLPDLSGEFNVSVSATITNNQGNETSSTVDVPVEITPVADAPIVSMEETCFDIVLDGNTTITMVINVTTGDVDLSEIISVYVADVRSPSKYVAAFPNITTEQTQVSVNMTITEDPDKLNSSVEITITATSVEISNGDEISTITTFAVPPCETEGTTPMEPPVIEVSPMFSIEDMPLPFPITVKLVNPSPNDTVELRLINILDIFTSTIGVEDGKDLVISISESRDLVLQPLPDLAGEFNVSVSATITNNQGNKTSSTVDVPVEITPVADEPIVSMEETTCFAINEEMNTIFTIVINVTTGDVDLSEIVSVNVSEPWNPSRNAAVFPNVTEEATQVSVTMTIIHVHKTDAPVEVTVHAISREKANGDQETTMVLFAVPLCEPDDVHVTTIPPLSGCCIKKAQKSIVILLYIILSLAKLTFY